MKNFLIIIFVTIFIFGSCKTSNKSQMSSVEPPKKKSAEWFYQQGVLEAKNTNSYVAIDNFTKAIKKKPDYVEAYFERASTYISTDSINSAVRDYDSLLVLKSTKQSDLGRIYMLKGNALYLNSADSAACECFRKARDLNYYPAWDRIRKICK